MALDGANERIMRWLNDHETAIERLRRIEVPRSVYCLVTNSGAQAVLNATVTDVAFNTELEDTDAMFNAGVSQTTMTVTVAGLYLVRGQFDWNSSAAGTRRLGSLILNGSTYLDDDDRSRPATGLGSVNLMAVVRLAGGDTLKLQAYQDSGGALSIVQTQGVQRFMVLRIAP
jgi:hypothetical protein